MAQDLLFKTEPKTQDFILDDVSDLKNNPHYEQKNLFNSESGSGITAKNPTIFSDLDSLYSYFKHLSDNKINSVDYDSKELRKAHFGNSNLVFDKHFGCVYPDSQLEYIFESQNIMDYSAWLVEGKEFKHTVCATDNILSESFYPNVTGDKWNPYVRYKSSSVCGSQQCSKIMDLVGIEHKDLSDPDFHKAVLNSITLSYPLQIDRLLLDERYRSRSQYKITKSGKKSSQKDITRFNLIDRMNRCFSVFFKELHNLFNVSVGKTLGCCDRLHLWSSEVPIMPNAHHHVIIPHFSYSKGVTKKFRSDVDFWDIEPLYENFKGCITETEISQNDLNVNLNSDVEGIKIQSPKKKSSNHRFVSDRILYNEFRSAMNLKLMDPLGYDPLPWFGLIQKENSLSVVEVPLDVGSVRELWSECVYAEFSDILGDRDGRLVDIHTKFISCSNKSKILHDLQYQTRPPVGDLDLFFKKVEGVVSDHDCLHLSFVKEYLQDLFVKYALKENVRLTEKYDSMVSKFDSLVSDFSDMDFYSWLQFLSVHVTQTKVRGFWRNIKRYMLDPDYKFLVKEEVCVVCGSPVAHVRYVSSPVIDYVIVRNKSNFCIFDFNGG